MNKDFLIQPKVFINASIGLIPAFLCGASCLMGTFIHRFRNGPRDLDTSLVTLQVIRDIVASGKAVAPVGPGHS